MARKSAAKHKARTLLKKKSYGIVGVDISLTSISGAMLAYDRLLDRTVGPEYLSVRFTRDIEYFDRLATATAAQKFIQDLSVRTSNCILDLDEVFIAVEEPWPAGIVRKAESGWLRQQAQIQGAFMGGLVKWGFRNVYEVNAQSWRKVVADELGVKLNRDFTKWSVKKWAIDTYEAPDLPDLIQTRQGLVPQPGTSRAKPVQPDDIYDACGIMRWMELTHAEI